MAQASYVGSVHEDRRRSALLSQLTERARERFHGENTSALEHFLEEYYAAVPLAERSRLVCALKLPGWMRALEDDRSAKEMKQKGRR